MKHQICRFLHKGLFFSLLAAALAVPSSGHAAEAPPAVNSDAPAAETQTTPPDIQPAEPETTLPTPAPIPAETPDTAPVPVPAETPNTAPDTIPTRAPNMTPTAAPTAKPTPSPKAKKPLAVVTGVKTIRYSGTSIKVTWKKQKHAVKYRIYAATSKKGTFRPIGTTEKNRYRIKRCKKNTTYYIRVQALAKKGSAYQNSKQSPAVTMKTIPYERITVFAGDSITAGLNSYRTLEQIHIGGKKKAVAAIGLNTVTFRTRRVYGPMSCLRKLISYKPYRVYMMLGINEIHYRKYSDMITQYKDLITAIKQESPRTDIVLLGVSPVTKVERQKRPGYWQIPIFNKKLKQLSKKMGLHYYNYATILKNKEGYLANAYSAGDGYHWNAAGYTKFAKTIETYDKSLDN